MNTRLGHWTTLALAALAWAGCDQEPNVRPGGCGLGGYDWLAAGQVGQVLDFEELPEMRMSAETLDALLRAAGQERFTPLAHGGRLYTLRYTTQDKGRPVEATGALALPWDEGAAPGDFPLVLFLHGTSGFTNACAPSRQAADAGLALLLLAAQGWTVVMPDYIGLDADADPAEPPAVHHAYVGIEQVALGSLDMLRATNELLAGELSALARPTRRVVLWGGSQGGHAVFACDRLAPFYAPELEVLAAIALVPATDLLGLARYATRSPNPATAGLAAVLASQNRWYQGTASLDEVLRDDPPDRLASRLLDVMDADCSPGDLFSGFDDLDQVFQPEILQAADADRLQDLEPWGCYLEQNSIATSSIPLRRHTPTLFVVAEKDDLVSAAVERADFDRLCALGYRLDYLECADANHTDGAAWSLPEQIDWLTERLAGVPIPPERFCQRRVAQRCELQPE